MNYNILEQVYWVFGLDIFLCAFQSLCANDVFAQSHKAAHWWFFKLLNTDAVFIQENQPNLKAPLFQAHGDADPVVPFSYGKQTQEYIAKNFHPDHELRIEHGLMHAANNAVGAGKEITCKLPNCHGTKFLSFFERFLVQTWTQAEVGTSPRWPPVSLKNPKRVASGGTHVKGGTQKLKLPTFFEKRLEFS